MFTSWAELESVATWEALESAAALECVPRVRLGCGIRGLLSLPAGSVDLVLSDLPSGETEAGFDVAPDLSALWPAIWHALKADGVAVLMASSILFAGTVIASDRKNYRYDQIWEKSIATGFFNVHHRPLRAHEFVLLFQRRRGTFVAQMTETGVPISTGSGQRRKKLTENYGRHGGSYSGRIGATDRYPRSVLHFGSLGQADVKRVHPQQKPEELLRYLVRTYSHPGETVADPFAGSGSTVAAAEAEGRSCLAWDTSPRFGVAS